MTRSSEFGFRATPSNQRVLAAVRGIDHPGVLADCTACMKDVSENPRRDLRFLGLSSRSRVGTRVPLRQSILSFLAAMG
jgi:hypothetical protein